jgi:hypothetical protein
MNPSCTSTVHLVLWLSCNNRRIWDQEKVVSFAEFDQPLTIKAEENFVLRSILRIQSSYSNASDKSNDDENVSFFQRRHYWRSHSDIFYERQTNLAIKNHEVLMKAKRANRFWISRSFGKNCESTFETVYMFSVSHHYYYLFSI